jgi:alkane 1-monooxygenase
MLSKTLTATDSQGREVSYRDRKRLGWLLSPAFALLPAAGMAAHAAMGIEWALGLPILLAFGLLPLLDILLGEDTNNPPEAVVPQLESDRFYRWLTWATVPLHYVALLGSVAWVLTHDLSALGYVLLAVSAGMTSGLGLNTAHELGHKHNPWEQWLARIALAIPAYGHFTVEHGKGHHRWVSTPGDPASARMGESIYRFALREIPGGVQRAWALEKERLAGLGCGPWSLSNTMLQSYAITAVLQGVVLLVGGWVLLPFLIIHNVFAWWQLTSANYVEHYGLLRSKDAQGRYESPKPHHSWNSNHIASNLVLFQLQRHSDHHANPSRRYQSLRHFDELPRLPSGYFGMFLLAYVPRLWYRVMDPRVLGLPHVKGDFSKVNLDPKRRQATLA